MKTSAVDLINEPFNLTDEAVCGENSAKTCLFENTQKYRRDEEKEVIYIIFILCFLLKLHFIRQCWSEVKL